MANTSSLSSKSVYEHKLVDIDGRETSLKEHEGKVLLIVNVASRCGFTGQYAGMEKLYRAYKDKGLVVCGFPCNQFGRQESGSDKEIKEFCTTKFGITFPIYSKIEVKGLGRHPLYEALTEKDSPTKGTIKWNFTKILVGREGKPIDRFGSLTSPSSGKLRKAIEKALEE
ncbi:MAG: glutathione peroxidase [Opitutales bacterium]